MTPHFNFVRNSISSALRLRLEQLTYHTEITPLGRSESKVNTELLQWLKDALKYLESIDVDTFEDWQNAMDKYEVMTQRLRLISLKSEIFNPVNSN